MSQVSQHTGLKQSRLVDLKSVCKLFTSCLYRSSGHLKFSLVATVGSLYQISFLSGRLMESQQCGDDRKWEEKQRGWLSLPDQVVLTPNTSDPATWSVAIHFKVEHHRYSMLCQTEAGVAWWVYSRDFPSTDRGSSRLWTPGKNSL